MGHDAFSVPGILFLRPDPAGSSEKGEFAVACFTAPSMKANSPFLSLAATASASIHPHLLGKNI